MSLTRVPGLVSVSEFLVAEYNDYLRIAFTKDYKGLKEFQRITRIIKKWNV